MKSGSLSLDGLIWAKLTLGWVMMVGQVDGSFAEGKKVGGCPEGTCVVRWSGAGLCPQPHAQRPSRTEAGAADLGHHGDRQLLLTPLPKKQTHTGPFTVRCATPCRDTNTGQRVSCLTNSPRKRHCTGLGFCAQCT